MAKKAKNSSIRTPEYSRFVADAKTKSMAPNGEAVARPADVSSLVTNLRTAALDAVGALADYLDGAEVIDGQVLHLLADMLDPPAVKRSPWFRLVQRGRPRAKIDHPDTIAAVLDNNELRVIASHLRNASLPDKRVIAWIVSRLRPHKATAPRLVLKRLVGRPRRSTTRDRLLGARIALELEQAGKLESAIAFVESQSRNRTHAYRSYRMFLERGSCLNLDLMRAFKPLLTQKKGSVR